MGIAQAGGRAECVEVGVGEVLDGAHLFDGRAVDLLDLAHERGQEPLVVQLDGELVDGHALAPLEHVDGDDVTPHRADAGGDLAEGAGTVLQPDANQHVHGAHGHAARPEHIGEGTPPGYWIGAAGRRQNASIGPPPGGPIRPVPPEGPEADAPRAPT